MIDQLLREHIEELAEAAVAEVRADSGGGLDASTAENLRLGVAAAIALFCERLADPDADVDTSLFERHGRLQQAGGRALEEMVRFYLLGGQAVRRRAEELADTTGATTADVLRLGDTLMRFINDLLQAAVVGYSAELTERSRLRRAARDQLWAALTSEPPLPRASVETAAQAAEWGPLPERVRAVVGSAGAEAAERRLPGSVLCAPLPDGRLAALVPDGPATADLAARAARLLGLGEPVVVGIAVASTDAAQSIAAAQALSQSPAAHGWMRCDEHLAETLLAGSPGVAAALAERRLAPLAALKAPQRRRLEDTLAAWLDHPGQPQAIATRLGLHVQTVRYRLRSLRAVLGDEAIDDPRARFELQLALRAQASQ